jgi:hypothetical protein
MILMTWKKLTVFVVCVLVAGSAFADGPVPLRRYAFVTGSNDGETPS